LPGSMRVSKVSGSPGRRMTGRWMGRMLSWKADSILQAKAKHNADRWREGWGQKLRTGWGGHCTGQQAEHATGAVAASCHFTRWQQRQEEGVEGLAAHCATMRLPL
jgi:hypothetical protein